MGDSNFIVDRLAQERGMTYHGKECREWHTLRYVATGQCVECQRLNNERNNPKRDRRKKTGDE